VIPCYPLIVDYEARRQRIADAAHDRYTLRGCEPGKELDDWLWAEKTVDAELLSGGIVPAKCDLYEGVARSF
jgi:hypothetical protein